MSNILENIRNPKPRRPWKIYRTFCCFMVLYSLLKIFGDPWLWQLTDHEELKNLVYLFGFLILWSLDAMGDEA